MTALAPSTIVVAMEQLDQELAVLTERRQLLQQLLATFDDDNGDTVERATAAWRQVARDVGSTTDLNERFALVDAAPAPSSPKTPKTKPAPVGRKRGTKGRKYDYAEVAQVIVEGVAAGKSATAALIERYDVTVATAGWLMKRCRELGYSRDERVSFVPTPIERAPFDPQTARDAAAGPTVGRVQPIGGPIRQIAPTVAQRPERFSHDDVAAALGAS